MNCWHCGREIPTIDRVGLRDDCPACGRSLHVCRNCDFYDPAYNNQCRETQAERVVDKERANFCDYFAPARHHRGAQARSQRAANLDALFKKKL
ncbi:MAG TPA: hypothetical protein VEJ86_01795 [Candidatus Binataceae bacterium]|nr:hypothetical protein [Candidatus Binataceae bacterium]